jgi:ankyrin repeat protein
MINNCLRIFSIAPLLFVWQTGNSQSSQSNSETSNFNFIEMQVIQGAVSPKIDDFFFLGTLQTGKLADAAGRGDASQMQRFVNDGAIVDGVGAYGMTPLLWAMGRRNLAGFTWLLEHGANPNLVSCCDGKDLDLSPMDIASALENSEFLVTLLAHGGNVNLRSGKQQQTPLFAALAYRRTQNIRLLIENHADVNAAEVDNIFVGGFARTPLSFAMVPGQYEASLLLLNAGANPCLKDASGHSVAGEMSVRANVGTTDADRNAYAQVVEYLKPFTCK